MHDLSPWRFSACDSRASKQELSDWLAATVGATVYSAELDDLSCNARFTTAAAESPHAMASTFKLYVLYELLRRVSANTVNFDQAIDVKQNLFVSTGTRPAWMEQPSVSLRTLATLMIQDSDNAATDHLIEFLGRAQVEAAIELSGHHKPELMRPLFEARDVYLLNQDPWVSTADSWSSYTETQRRNLVGWVEAFGASPLKGWWEPKYVSTLEWFARPDDLCRVMRSITQLGVDVNPILGRPTPAWPYVWGKAGGQPGVASDAVLVFTRDSKWRFGTFQLNSAQSLEDGIGGQLSGALVELLVFGAL